VEQPLAGIRVCDVTQNLAGPFCAQILADLGATVIKVEPPGGDLGRAWGPPFWGDDSTLFLSSNRGKQSVVVGLKDTDGMAVLRRLATSCDIFVQASRPSAARRLGIDYESVRGWRDDVIHLSVSAYGPDGPMSDQPGYDPLMQAYAGIMSVTGQPGGPPTRVGGSVVDFGTGMWAVIAILAALRTRDATGQGAALDASLMDTSLGWVSYHLMGYMATGVTPGPMGSGLGSIAPYRAFRTADGHVMIAAGNDGIFGRLCTALDAAGLADDPRFATNADRVRHRADLDPLIEALTERLSTERLLQLAQAHGIPASAIRNIAEVVDDAQVAASDMIPSVAHPGIDGYRDVSLPIQMNGSRPRAEGVPPAAGADTRPVLVTLGYSDAEIDDLLERGVVEGLSRRDDR